MLSVVVLWTLQVSLALAIHRRFSHLLVSAARGGTAAIDFFAEELMGSPQGMLSFILGGAPCMCMVVAVSFGVWRVCRRDTVAWRGRALIVRLAFHLGL